VYLQQYIISLHSIWENWKNIPTLIKSEFQKPSKFLSYFKVSTSSCKFQTFHELQNVLSYFMSEMSCEADSVMQQRVRGTTELFKQSYWIQQKCDACNLMPTSTYDVLALDYYYYCYLWLGRWNKASIRWTVDNCIVADGWNDVWNTAMILKTACWWLRPTLIYRFTTHGVLALI